MGGPPRDGDGEALGHRFADPALLRRALTHRSVGAEHPAAAGQHNERLEFLGDAVVGLVVSAWLFREFPDWPEGELTRLRAQLVRGPTLASLARRYRIDERLLLGKGAQVQGAREHERVLAGAFEAVVGAIFVDGGWEAARSSLERCLPDALRLVRPPSQANPKGALQELLAKLNRPAPEYRVVEMEGPPHQRRFTVELRCPPDVTVRAQGHSRQAAEEAAARLVLERLRAGPSQVL